MKINKIEIQNFRGFEHYSCELTDPCLIVGNKGSGKTSLIEALAIAAGSLFLGFDDISGRQRHGIQKKDVRQYPVVISCQGIVNEQELTWTRTLEKENGKTTWGQAKEIKTIAEQLQKNFRDDKEVLLPIIAYYSADRFWPNKSLKKVEIDQPGQRSKGYLNWFNPPANTNKLWNWLSWMEFIARDKRKPLKIFIAVKDAIVESLPEIEEVIYEMQGNQLLLKIENEKINFWSLDEPKRNFLGMVADIAYRCVNLNPQFNAEATKQTPGVVLIDDLEFHLDSEFEKNIMNRLRRIFPMIQFIGTTQSSLIIEGMDSQQIVNLPSL